MPQKLRHFIARILLDARKARFKAKDQREYMYFQLKDRLIYFVTLLSDHDLTDQLEQKYLKLLDRCLKLNT